MGIGGVEKALLGLVNSYDYASHHVDLMLTKPEGEFMSYIKPEVNLIKAPTFFLGYYYLKIGFFHPFLIC